MRQNNFILYTLNAVPHFHLPHFPSPELQAFSISCGGEVLLIKVHAFKLVKSIRPLPFFAFLFSCERELYPSRITHLISWLLFLDLGVLCRPHAIAFRISFGGEFYVSKFAQLILRLCYSDLGLLCSPHHFCLQHLIRGRPYTYHGLRISRGERFIQTNLFLLRPSFLSWPISLLCSPHSSGP